jgi:hypothetical protein
VATRRTRRADPLTLTQLIQRVRRSIGDIVDDATPGTGDRRWEDVVIVDAINDMMAEMYQELQTTPDNVLDPQTIVYTGGAQSIDLQNLLPAFAVYAVYEERDGGGAPNLLRYVGALDIARYRTDDESIGRGTERVWSFRDNDLFIRPIPGGNVTLTVITVGRPFSMDAAAPADFHPYPVVHEELMVLGAANRLQYPNDQLPVGRQGHYQRLWIKWVQDCERYQGPKFPVDSRRFR